MTPFRDRRARFPVRSGGSLRRRIVIRVAGIALALSCGLGFATYLIVRNTIIEEREAAAVEQVIADATLVVSTLDVAGINEAAVLAMLRPPARSRPLLSVDGRWYTASLQVQPTDVPAELQQIVFAGSAAKQRFRLNGDPVLAVGVPLAGGDAAYFEVFSLQDVAATLGTLARTLALAGAAATALGALAGWGISRRILRPLYDVSEVAAQIAAGQLDTRLDETADRDLARLTASFNAMAHSLEQRIAREAQFSSDVSHELRSPLTTIATSISVLDHRRDELSPEGREALDLLSADLKRFQALVTDLLEMSRHDAGVATIERSPFEPATFVRRALRRLGEETVSLRISPDAESAVVYADPRRLERSIANILDNARVHAGGATAVSVEATANTVRIAVDDEGPGVAPDDREVVFERFARGASAGQRGSRDGSGLGLALARENVRAQGGRISVDDAPGGGARFVIELPRADA
jgi:two-component system, OmpR family, sensor histidine kinase MtrB